MDDIIVDACQEWQHDERNIQYSEIVGVMETLPVAQPVTPMMLIDRAQASGASIEQMQQLFELQLVKGFVTYWLNF